MNRAEVKIIVSESMALPLTATMSAKGFRYQRGPLRYRRETKRSQQDIDFAFDVAPTYAPGSLFVLHPQIRVEYPEASALTEIEGRAGTGVAVLQPVAFGVRHGARKQWTVRSEKEVVDVANDLGSEIENQVMPLLDELIDPEGLIAAYARRDGKISWHVQVIASVIALLLNDGRVEDSLSVAKESFRGSSLEIQYPRLAERLQFGQGVNGG